MSRIAVAAALLIWTVGSAAASARPAADRVIGGAADPAYTTLVWSDEFSGPAGSPPDPSKWTIKTGRPWNNGANSYTARASNVSLDGAGALDLTARRETYTGADGVTRDYTSGAVMTKDNYSLTYGRLEARISVPAGRGFWPAFWTLRWPIGGEIDVMEVLGQSPSTLYAHIHSLKADGTDYWEGGSYRSRDPLSDGYHVYGATWRPDRISYDLDGFQYYSVSPSDLPSDYQWGFTDPEWIVLNLGVGGDWPLEPNSTTPFPARMKVDWVRVYQ